MENIYIHMPYGAYGDQISFIGAARIYAKRHTDQRVHVNVLPNVINAYGDGLLTFTSNPAGMRRIDFQCVNRHRVKNASPDKTYVGTYLAALGEPVTDAPAFEPPRLPSKSGGRYIALQPYSTFARNAANRTGFVQALIDECHRILPNVPIYCIGRPDTPRDLKDIDYSRLGYDVDGLRLIEHAWFVLTPRSASSHIAAGYRKPTFLWLCGDGEDWHLDYPCWPRMIVSVDDSHAVTTSALRHFITSQS